MNDFGKVSVIMPTYNSSRFVIESIRSVFSQTYQNLEIIIVDNCSTDETVDLIRSLNDERIHIFVNTQNFGEAYSRNRALREANGDWIAFLDSDDIWCPTKLERQLVFMNENGYSFCYSKYLEIDQNGEPTKRYFTGPRRITKRIFSHYDYIGFLTAIYSSKKVGCVQVNDKIFNGASDQAILQKAINKTDCYLYPEITSFYRIVSGSPSHSGKFRSLKYQYTYYRLEQGRNFISAWLHALSHGFYYVFGKRFVFKRKLSKKPQLSDF